MDVDCKCAINFGVVYLVQAHDPLILPNTTKFENQPMKLNKYNVAMDPGIKINKANKSKVKDPAN